MTWKCESMFSTEDCADQRFTLLCRSVIYTVFSLAAGGEACKIKASSSRERDHQTHLQDFALLKMMRLLFAFSVLNKFS